MMRAWRTGLAIIGFLYVPGGAAASTFTVPPLPAADRSATTIARVWSGESTQVQAVRARPARVACRLPAGSPASALTAEPWAQRRLNFTAVWPLTTGTNIAVAVVDTGVDAGHPQLTGRVKSYDLTKTNDQDCVGHGTGVAGIIAGQDLRGRRIPFLGVAPGSKIISVKYTNSQSDPEGGSRLAAGIRLAVDKGAKVVNVSSAAQDSSPLRSAVAYAREKDVLVVAAAGNVTDEEKGTQVPAYPANYPDVISVGAVGEGGGLEGFSNVTTRVSVTAPGQQVVSAWPGEGYTADKGTSFAAPFVAGTAALVRSYHPELSAAQVKARIEATADGGTAGGTGGGTINPLRAVTAVLAGEGTGAAPAAGPPRAVSIDRPDPRDRLARSAGLGVAIGAIAAAGLVTAGAAIIPAGRRRGWRPGRRSPTREPAGPDPTPDGRERGGFAA